MKAAKTYIPICYLVVIFYDFNVLLFKRRRKIWERQREMSGIISFPTFSEVVLIGMDNDGAAEDALFAVKRDDRVLHVDFGDARAIRLHVPQISRVALKKTM